MKPELKSKIMAFNRSVKRCKEKADDMDKIVTALVKLPLSLLKTVLAEDMLAVLRRYGLNM